MNARQRTLLGLLAEGWHIQAEVHFRRPATFLCSPGGERRPLHRRTFNALREAGLVARFSRHGGEATYGLSRKGRLALSTGNLAETRRPAPY